MKPIETNVDEEWEDPYPKKQSWNWWAGIPMMLVLYVLSVGPMFRLAQNGTLPWRSFEVIYAPLDLAARFKPVDRFVQWYIFDVWKASAPVIPPGPRAASSKMPVK